MKTIKHISLITALIMCMCLICCDSNTKINPEDNYTILPGNSWWYAQPADENIIQMSEIKTISFVESQPEGTPVKEWNVDVSRLGNIRCCVYGSAGMYNLYIVGSIIRGHADSDSFFSLFEELTSVSFNHFDTSGVTDMSFMFYMCQNMENINLSSLNLSNVRDSSRMFYYFGKLGTSVKINSQYADFFNETELGNKDWWSYSSGVYSCVTVPKYECKVTYYDGAEILEGSTKVKYGYVLSPNEYFPEKDGNVFLGWFYDSACTDCFDGSKVVKDDINLYSKWAPGTSAHVEANIMLTELSLQYGDKVTAVFSAGGYSVKRSEIITQENVKSVILDSCILSTTGTIDVTVVSSGESIKGSVEKDVTFENGKVYDVIVLVEGAEYHNVSFETNGGSVVSSQPVKDGNPVSKPSPDPTRKDYSFDGWYVDPSCTGSSYDFTIPVTSDLILYAKWAPVSASEKWCVMAYMDFSNLTSDALKNLDEICMSTPNDNVKAYFLTGGSSGSYNISTYPNLASAIQAFNPSDPFGPSFRADTYQLWEYTSGGKFVELSSPVKGMNDSNVLSQFMQHCCKMAEGSDPDADFKYILELWDHGGGSYVGLVRDNALRSQSFEGVIMSLADCGNTIKAVTKENKFKFEVVVFDMCLMQSIESAHAISYEAANYIIGSQTSTSTVGSAYTEWFNFLYEHPEANGYEFGRLFCDTAYDKINKLQYDDFRKNVTWSVIDMSKFGAVESAYESYAVSDLTSVSALTVEKCLKMIDSMPAFDSQYYIPFWEMYMYDINVFTKTLGSSSAGLALMRAVDNAIVYKKYGITQNNAGCCGLSMCILTNSNGWNTDFDYSKKWNDAYLEYCLTPNYRVFQKRIADNL